MALHRVAATLRANVDKYALVDTTTKQPVSNGCGTCG
jgi:hypothetical protein